MNERRKLLEQRMKKFNKDQKEEILFFGDEIEDQEVISTGIKSIDNYLGGGIKRGTHTIFWGNFSCGKTSLALQIIGNAQREGKICAYINLEKPVDKERFIAMGVNLKELVRADCTKNAEQALSIIQVLCRDKVVDLIVLDSIQALSPKAENENKGKERELDEKTMGELARTMSEFCRRVNADIYRAKAGIIWIGQIRLNIGPIFQGVTLTGGEAIKFYAYQIIYMRKGQSSDAPVRKYKNYFLDPDDKLHYQTIKEPIGHDCVFRMDKSNAKDSVKEKVEQHFAFIGEQGFVDEVRDSEEIPIKIEGTKEQQTKIKELLKMKDRKILMDNGGSLQFIETRGTIIPNKNEIPPQPKRKRGRPKKEKK